MNRHIIRGIFFILIMGSFSYTASAQHKIVMHMSSADTLVWKGLMNNLKHLKEGWGDQVTIEVVTHGPGVEMMMKEKTTQLNNINHYRQMGIPFYVCENTLREKKIDKQRIVEAAGFVPMGIGEIVMKQEQGWSYIKVGF